MNSQSSFWSIENTKTSLVLLGIFYAFILMMASVPYETYQASPELQQATNMGPGFLCMILLFILPPIVRSDVTETYITIGSIVSVILCALPYLVMTIRMIEAGLITDIIDKPGLLAPVLFVLITPLVFWGFIDSPKKIEEESKCQ